MTQEQTPITREQLEWIEASTIRSANKVLKRYSLRALLGFLILFGGLAVAGRVQAQKLHDGLVGSCKRVNVLRAQSNLSDTVSFNILSISGRREVALVKLDSEAAAAHRKSADGLFAEAEKLTITRLTNCEQAVGSPDSYTTPIAGPIGDPSTGKLDPGVMAVFVASTKLLHHEGVNHGAP